MEENVFTKNKNIAFCDYLLSVLQKLEYLDNKLIDFKIKTP